MGKSVLPKVNVSVNSHSVTAQVLVLDRPTDIGNIYPRSVIENALVHCFKIVLEGRMFVFPLEIMQWTDDSNQLITKIGDALGVVERLYIETQGDIDYLMAQMLMYNVPKPSIKYRPTAFGTIGHDRVVRDDYEIQHINVQDDAEARLRATIMRKMKRRSVT